MAQSSVAGGRRMPQRDEGNRVGLLGPSDTSDSGSDIMGGPGLADTQAQGLDEGTTSDIDRSLGAGADYGDPELDAQSDSTGTGERALADRDGGFEEAGDISPDRVERLDPLDATQLEAMSEEELDGISGENLVVDEDEGSPEDPDEAADRRS